MLKKLFIFVVLIVIFMQCLSKQELQLLPNKRDEK